MEFSLGITLTHRKNLVTIIDTLSVEQLNTIPKGFNNNIFWNIAHLVVTQQLLVYKLSGNDLLIEDVWVDKYRKGTKPEHDITKEDVEQLKSLLVSTIEQTIVDYKAGKFANYTSYTVTTITQTLDKVEQAIEFNNYHEGLHYGYVLAMRKLI